MFWIKTLITFVILAITILFGSVLERHLASKPSSRPGLILPFLATMVATAISMPNFIIAVDVIFSPVAFASAVGLFVFYMLPAIVFILIYIEQRERLLMRKKSREGSSRQVRRNVTREVMEPRPPAARRKDPPRRRFFYGKKSKLTRSDDRKSATISVAPSLSWTRQEQRSLAES